MLKDYTSLDEFIQVMTHPSVRRTATASLGFTIVELLIVVTVIGVLAAIVIVAYGNVTSSANDSSVKSDASSLTKKIEQYKITYGSAPASAANLATAGIKATQVAYHNGRNNFYYCTNGTNYSFGLVTASNVHYYLTDGVVSPASGVNYANTCANVTSSTYGVTGFDWPGDGAGSGWASWTE